MRAVRLGPKSSDWRLHRELTARRLIVADEAHERPPDLTMGQDFVEAMGDPQREAVLRVDRYLTERFETWKERAGYSKNLDKEADTAAFNKFLDHVKDTHIWRGRGRSDILFQIGGESDFLRGYAETLGVSLPKLSRGDAYSLDRQVLNAYAEAILAPHNEEGGFDRAQDARLEQQLGRDPKTL